MRTANFTEFRRNLSHYLDSVIENSDQVIIPRGGDDGAVLMSLKDYNAYREARSIAETEYIMSSPAMMKAICEAEQQVANGEYITLDTKEDMDRFFEELEREIESGSENNV